MIEITFDVAAPSFSAMASPTRSAATSMTIAVVPPKIQPIAFKPAVLTMGSPPQFAERYRGSAAPDFHSTSAARISAAKKAQTTEITSIESSRNS